MKVRRTEVIILVFGILDESKDKVLQPSSFISFKITCSLNAFKIYYISIEIFGKRLEKRNGNQGPKIYNKL